MQKGKFKLISWLLCLIVLILMTAYLLIMRFVNMDMTGIRFAIVYWKELVIYWISILGIKFIK